MSSGILTSKGRWTYGRSRVQHRATRMIPGLAKLDFEVRLEKKMDLPSLTFRSARGDAIETYKYLHRFYAVDSSHMLPLHTTELNRRSHYQRTTASNYKKRLQDTASNELLELHSKQLEQTARKNCTGLLCQQLQSFYDRHYVDQRSKDRYQF